MRLRWAWSLAILAATGAGCQVTRPGEDAPTRFDTPVRDTGIDAPPAPCTTSADCNDSIACTSDACAFGGVCEHVAQDALCTVAGEHCEIGVGCTAGSSDCSTPADCMVGRTYCDGLWTCIGGTCYVDTPRDCADGNACTDDICDDSLSGGAGGCRYEVADGCDGGTLLGDGGVAMCDPFVPATGYAGTFLMLPSPSSGCGGSAPSYRAMDLTFSVAAGTLSVSVSPGLDGAPFVMTGTAPTGASFDVMYSDGCFRGRLMGMFTCQGRFSGTFTGTYSGSCAICSGGAPFTVQGILR